MSEEYQGVICGGNWWNSSKNLFGPSGCSSEFGWPAAAASDFMMTMDMQNNKNKYSSDESGSNSDNSIVFQEQPPVNNNSMDPTLQIMPNAFSTSDHWNNQDNFLHGNGKLEASNYSNLFQDNMNSGMNYGQEAGICEDSRLNQFKQVNNHQGFPSVEQPLNSAGCISTTISSTTCQGSTTGFPSSSVPNNLSSSSILLQNLLSNDSPPVNYPLATNFRMNSNEFSPKLSSFSKTSLPKPQLTNHLPFANPTLPFLNTSLNTFLPSSAFNLKANSLSNKLNNEEGRDMINNNSGSKKASCSEPAFKRPRIETPSPLPTFKVRKEKLGDRITALQQLVSPFGKTDTASVLHEAIEYIKYLHDQVIVLSTPYMKNGSQVQRQQAVDRSKDQEGQTLDLRSRGLCLVPISSTFPMAAQATTDFWHPTFGAPFRSNFLYYLRTCISIGQMWT